MNSMIGSVMLSSSSSPMVNKEVLCAAPVSLVSLLDTALTNKRPRPTVIPAAPAASNPFDCFFLDDPTTSRKRRRRTAVRFAENPTTATYASSATPKDLENAWYSNSDIHEFCRQKKRTIKALKMVDGDLMALRRHQQACLRRKRQGAANKDEDDGIFCIRGLESYQSSRFNRAVRRQRATVIQGVIQCQEWQRSVGLNQPDILRQIVTKKSVWAKRWALELASIDAQERYHSIFEDECDEELPVVISDAPSTDNVVSVVIDDDSSCSSSSTAPSLV